MGKTLGILVSCLTTIINIGLNINEFSCIRYSIFKYISHDREQYNKSYWVSLCFVKLPV